MRLKYFSFLAVFLLALTVFLGCNNSPNGPSSEEDRSFSGDPLIVEVEKNPVDGKIGISFYLTSKAYDSVNTKTEITGFEDGELQGTYIKKDDRLFFWVEVAPGIYVFDFCGDKDCMNEDIVVSDSLYIPEIGKFAIKVTKDYKVIKASRSEVLHLGKGEETVDLTDSVIVVNDSDDGKLIIYIVKDNDTIPDTVTISKIKGTIVFWGDSVIFKKNPSSSSLGYDTVRIDVPARAGEIDYDDVVEMTTFKSVMIDGVKEYKLNLSFDTILVDRYENKDFEPFTIGYAETDSAWKSPQDINLNSGRYTYTTAPLKPGLIKFGVGGSYNDGIWARSDILKKTPWGFETDGGWIIAGWLFPDGRFVAWSLVDTSSGETVIKDTVETVDTLIIHDTITVKGEKVIVHDTVLIIERNDDTITVIDTVHYRDTVVVKNTVFSSDTIVFRDTVVSYDTIVEEGDTIKIRDSIFVIQTRIDTFLQVDTLHSVDTLRIVDQGVRDTIIIGISRDTLWIDTVNYLKGVAEIDSVYRTLHIHEVLMIFNNDSALNADTSVSTRLIVLSRDTFDLVFQFVSAEPVAGDTFLVDFKITDKIFDDSIANVLGIEDDWNERINSSSKSDGYFNFTNIRMVKGKNYQLNFVSSGTAWAEQSMLLWSYLAYQERSSVDLTPSLNDDVTDFVYAPPAAQ